MRGRTIRRHLIQQRGVKFVHVFRYGGGIHGYVGKLVGMSLKVNFQIALGGKTTAADIALEGTFTGVRAYVYLQSGIRAKDLATVATTMLEERFIAILVAILGAKGILIRHIVGQNSLGG